MKINDVLFKRVIENHNVINVNANKISEDAKNIVYFSLNVEKEILEFYDCYIELFLLFVKNNDKFMTINHLDKSLMKKICDIEN